MSSIGYGAAGWGGGGWGGGGGLQEWLGLSKLLPSRAQRRESRTQNLRTTRLFPGFSLNLSTSHHGTAHAQCIGAESPLGESSDAGIVASRCSEPKKSAMLNAVHAHTTNTKSEAAPLRVLRFFTTWPPSRGASCQQAFVGCSDTFP